jgi:hypothetical protein
MRVCPECERELPEKDFIWTSDRYGNPWRKVCSDCGEKVRAEIMGWVLDPADAGERLEPEEP